MRVGDIVTYKSTAGGRIVSVITAIENCRATAVAWKNGKRFDTLANFNTSNEHVEIIGNIEVFNE